MIFQNEALFLVHLAILLGATLVAARLGALPMTLLICLEAALANLFVTKEIYLFSLAATPTEVFAVSSLLGLNLLREFYGQEAARRAVYLSIGALLFTAFMAWIQLAYVPHPLDQTHPAFQRILSSSPRIFLASLSVYFIVQQVDLWIFSKLKTTWPLVMRLSTTLFLSEALDTALFTFFGLYGIMSSLLSIFYVSLGLKYLTILLSSPFVAAAKKMVRVE